MNSPLDLLPFAMAAAERASTFLKAAARPSPDQWSTKGQSDFVTDIDREAERLIREELGRGPAMEIMGEECSPDATPSGWHWIVDPLDGTTNYLHGSTRYAVSIAAVQNGVPEAGVVHRPADQTVFHAIRGGGAWCGSERLSVSAIADPALALLGTGFPFKHLSRLPTYLSQFDRILRATSGIRRGGSAALDLVDVAAGRFDGFWECYLAPWDVAAGILLVTEAGGRVTDASGTPHTLQPGSTVAANPFIHPWLLNTLRE